MIGGVGMMGQGMSLRNKRSNPLVEKMVARSVEITRMEIPWQPSKS